MYVIVISETFLENITSIFNHNIETNDKTD